MSDPDARELRSTQSGATGTSSEGASGFPKIAKDSVLNQRLATIAESDSIFVVLANPWKQASSGLPEEMSWESSPKSCSSIFCPSTFRIEECDILYSKPNPHHLDFAFVSKFCQG